MPTAAPSMVDLRNKEIINQRTGKREYVFVNLHQIYPDADNPDLEYSLEELKQDDTAFWREDG